jgi:hypothetical protein
MGGYAAREADMTNSAEKNESDVVSCNVCHQEVAHAESLAVEAQEYLYFFCGAGCYTHWQEAGGTVVNGS